MKNKEKNLFKLHNMAESYVWCIIEWIKIKPIGRILKRTREDYVLNALTEQAYLNNKKKFEAVDLDDLKSLYPNLSITHLIVDTRYDPPEDWNIIGVERK